MRVTNWMLLNSALYDMEALREKYAAAQKKVYGRSLERPSDDPQRVVEAIDLTSMKVKLERAQRAATDAKEWLSVAETSLSAIIEHLQAVQETMIQFGSPASQEPSAREALAQQIEALRDAIRRELNAQHRDRYLFAGWATNQQPFVDDPNTSGGVMYKGSSHKIEREIAPGYKVAINITGDQLPYSIVETLTKAADDIRNGNQSDVLTNHLDAVKQALNDVIERRSDLGLSMRQLELFEGYARDGLISIEERLGKISGGDLAEAVMRMTEAQEAYQAALMAFSRALPMTLLDYMFR